MYPLFGIVIKALERFQYERISSLKCTMDFIEQFYKIPTNLSIIDSY